MRYLKFRISCFLQPCLISILLLFVLKAALPANAATVLQGRKLAADQVTVTYVNAVFTEDTTWRGTVVVKGSCVVAPQATLRIEPGTVIRFMTANTNSQLPFLVVRGRIQSIGTSDRPILFTSGYAVSNKGDWGGVLLLSSEKRNQFEYCQIDGAETAVEGRFCTVNFKTFSITKSTNGCLFRDTLAALASLNVSDCDTGVEVHDSELELRETVITGNRRGILLFRSSAVMSSVAVTGSTQQAMLSEDCRIKLNSCEISDNTIGAQIVGGEGQIFLSRFIRNRGTALHLSTARLKISRCQISDNLRDGLKLEDDRTTVWGNSISDNGGYNLVYTGKNIVNASQNWWGSNVESSVIAKISAPSASKRSAAVSLFPWLTEKPTIFQ